MKAGANTYATVAQAPLRALRSAAPLKAHGVLRRRDRVRRSPRSPERGSVEGRVVPPSAAFIARSPRSPERGSVEGRRCRCPPWPRLSALRALRSAAPLKVVVEAHMAQVVHPLRALRSAAPLKEVGRGDVRPCLRTSPRSPERGSVEGSKCWAGSASPCLSALSGARLR